MAGFPSQRALGRRGFLLAAVGAGAFGRALLASPSLAGALVRDDRVWAAAGAGARTLGDVVPAPVAVLPAPGTTYVLAPGTRIHAQAGSAEAARIGSYLAGILRPSTGYPLPVVGATTPRPANGIFLLLSGAGARVGGQGYRLTATKEAVVIRANTPAGLFAGVQTLRQLLPAAVESTTAQPGPWTVPGGHIVDYPRFAYRGAMLDVARHFFTVDTVKRYIDEISLYKVNHLHLHLTDDQGWRIQIERWPRLATHGGSTEVGGGPGGYYTKDEYREIVAHAAQRYVTIVPEIDMPGHVNAALASYAELNCDGKAPPLHTGIEVGFSALCVDKEITYRFVDDVIGEVAQLSPGPYVHIGGDEAKALSAQDYAAFMNRAQRIVEKHGKKVMGWHQIAAAEPVPSRVVQYWGLTDQAPGVVAATRQGTDVLQSPANHAYLDQKYDEDTPLGLSWAGFVSVEDAYSWDPGSHIKGVRRDDVLGVEAPLWSETLQTMDEIEFMAFPRLPAIAELGWSPASTHDWKAFRRRLGAQGPRWSTMGVNYYASPQVPWTKTPSLSRPAV